MSGDAGEGGLPPRKPSRRPAGARPPGAGGIPEAGGSTFRPAQPGPGPAPGAKRAPRPAAQPRTERTPTPATGGPSWVERIVFGSVSTSHLGQFCRQFAAYLDAGVDLLRSLASLEQQFSKTALGPVIGRLQLAVRRGDALAEAMARETGAFDQLMISLMRVAEARGGVPETLRTLAVHYEARLRLLRQARSAAIYPTIVLIVAAGVVTLLALFVLPVLADLLADLSRQGGGELPLPSRWLIAITKFVQGNGWWVIPVAVVGTLVALRMAYKKPAGKAVMDAIALRVPVLGTLLGKLDVTRFARALAALLEGGVDIGSSLALAAGVVRTAPYRRAVERAREGVMQGSEFSEALRATHRFGTDFLAIVNSGEETGKLPESLERLADDYEEQVEYMVKNLGHLIQPLIMIILGGVVLFIILAVILPYISLISSLTR